MQAIVSSLCAHEVSLIGHSQKRTNRRVHAAYLTAAITNDDNSIQLSSHRRVKLAQATAELSLFFIPRQLDWPSHCKRLCRWRAEAGTEAVNMVVWPASPL